jgi:ABC-type glycerol-3-phosphate transport system substrate-binding protein
MASRVSRRRMLKLLGGAGAGAMAGRIVGAPAVIGQQTVELVHWSTHTASDAEVWKQMIDNFNAAHQGKGVQIRHEVVSRDQYGTKILATAATGNAPDFGTAEAGLRADWAKKGVILPLEEPFKQIGFDLSDFKPELLAASRYGGRLYLMPLDAMSLQVLLNVDHATAAGLDVTKPPQTGDELLAWAGRMTQRQGERVTRSGWLMTGSGIQPQVVWGIVAHQMGFRRASPDLKRAGLNPDAGKQAAQWVLDLFDRHRVSSRDVADRYKAFGTGEGSMFITGPWTLNGYVQQKVNFVSFRMPKVGQDRSTYFELGGLEMYVQRDKSRLEVTARALKWLSDNSLLWATKGRVFPARSSLAASQAFKTGGYDWKIRGAFIDGMADAVIGEIPVSAAPNFQIYNSRTLVAKTMDLVWAKQMSPEAAIETLTKQWQSDLEAG